MSFGDFVEGCGDVLLVLCLVAWAHDGTEILVVFLPLFHLCGGLELAWKVQVSKM
jgi:hypothetical protein